MIGPAEVGLLATLGWPQVRVRRRPRVAILSTGNELADLGQEPGPGADPEHQHVRADGADDRGGWRADQPRRRRRPTSTTSRAACAPSSTRTCSCRRRASPWATWISCARPWRSWGPSCTCGASPMRPGKPITFGSLRGRPLFGLPGNPVSAMVTFELFVRPGAAQDAGPRRARSPAHRGPGRRAHPQSRPAPGLSARHPHPGARPLRGPADRRAGLRRFCRSMVLADGFAVVPGDTVIEKGETSTSSS